MSENDEAILTTIFILYLGVIKMQEMAILLIFFIVILIYDDIYYKIVDLIPFDVDDKEDNNDYVKNWCNC